MNVLRRGGSAVDAAIAVQAMLSLVEPQSSGIGGGAFMTYYDAGSRRVTVYDGRETAPAGATPDMFLDDNGAPLPFARAVLSGRATGVPGVVRMLHHAHGAHGRLPWRDLFGDAERTARAGFPVSPRLGRMIGSDWPQNGAPDVRAYFAEGDGTLLDPGDTLRNPAYADFLRRLAAEGPDALYRGATARRIVARVRRRRAAGIDDPRRPRRLPAGRARAALPLLSPHPDLRSSAAVERDRRPSADGDPRAHRYRHRAAPPIPRPGSCSPRRAG